MTTLLSWVGTDDHGASSIYLASDSRYSYGSTWDYGQKIFSCNNYPVIIGYCGDVVFANCVMHAVTYYIDHDLLYNKSLKADEKNSILNDFVAEKFRKFPVNSDTTIIHILKDEEKKFRFFENVFTKRNRVWSTKEIDLAKKISSEERWIGCYGSGKEELIGRLNSNRDSPLSGLSRFYYMVFAEFVKDCSDVYTGGAPQLKGLYRGGDKVAEFGIIHNGNRYVNGLTVDMRYNLDKIEWRNNGFERCDPNTMELRRGAQRQPLDKGLKKSPWK